MLVFIVFFKHQQTISRVACLDPFRSELFSGSGSDCWFVNTMFILKLMKVIMGVSV